MKKQNEMMVMVMAAAVMTVVMVIEGGIYLYICVSLIYLPVRQIDCLNDEKE